jgi:hypothetical protein
VAAVALLIAVLGLAAWGIDVEIGLWKECRRDHSFWYCNRVLGGR